MTKILMISLKWTNYKFKAKLIIIFIIFNNNSYLFISYLFITLFEYYHILIKIMAFASALINHSLNNANRDIGENGQVLYEHAEHTGVTAFNKLVRDETANTKSGKTNQLRIVSSRISNKKTLRNIDIETDASANAVDKYYGDMLNAATAGLIETRHSGKSRQLMLDTWVLPFFKRTFTKTIKNPDGTATKQQGEGERRIFYQMFIKLYLEFPKTALGLIRHIPTFGYWGDLFSIWQLMDKRIGEGKLTSSSVQDYKVTVLKEVITQLKQDERDMNNDNQCSLLGKWIPREKSQKDRECSITVETNTYSLNTALSVIYGTYKCQGAASEEYMLEYITKLLTNQHTPKTQSMYCRTFRKALSALNKHLNTFEVKACSKKWSEVKPGSIPSKALAKYSTAILNEKKNTRLTVQEEDTGNRYPEDQDRVEARRHMIEYILSGADIKISGVEPHEILKAYQTASTTSQKLIAMKQWDAKVEEVFQTMVESEGLDIEDTDSLTTSRICGILPMMDVSGSMMGIPMDVSIGLGLFIIALQKRFGLSQRVAISFTETPRVFDLTNMTLEEQIKHLNANVGYTTNFEAAIDLVLDVIKQTGVSKNLMVFTDGQFDQMNKSYSHSINTLWTTSHQRILQKVATLGIQEAPNIIYWNLRLNTVGVQATATHPGVQLLQGYSPAIMKFALFGGEFEEEEIEVIAEDGTKANVKVSKKTPYDTYRGALDQSCFDIIRQLVFDSHEGVLSMITM
jgi:hypothetical protein